MALLILLNAFGPEIQPLADAAWTLGFGCHIASIVEIRKEE